MASYSSRIAFDLSDLRRVRFIYEGAEISYSITNGVESNIMAGALQKVLDEAPTGTVVSISPVGSVSSKLWRMRLRYLFAFSTGIIFSFVVQFLLTVWLI